MSLINVVPYYYEEPVTVEPEVPDYGPLVWNLSDNIYRSAQQDSGGYYVPVNISIGSSRDGEDPVSVGVSISGSQTFSVSGSKVLNHTMTGTNSETWKVYIPESVAKSGKEEHFSIQIDWVGRGTIGYEGLGKYIFNGRF